MCRPSENKIGEITVKPVVFNLIAIVVSIALIAGAVIGTALRPHAIPDGRYDLAWILIGLVVFFSLHELIHAFALMRSAHLPWKAFRFGILWHLMAIYCHCRHPVTIRAQRVCALAPLMTLGLLSVLATLAYPAIWLAILTSTHLSGCIGDVWMFKCSRRFSEDCLYVDFKDKFGGEVFEPPIAGASMEPFANG